MSGKSSLKLPRLSGMIPEEVGADLAACVYSSRDRLDDLRRHSNADLIVLLTEA